MAGDRPPADDAALVRDVAAGSQSAHWFVSVGTTFTPWARATASVWSNPDQSRWPPVVASDSKNQALIASTPGPIAASASSRPEPEASAYQHSPRLFAL